MKRSIEHLSKHYGNNTWGIQDLSLELEPGVLGVTRRAD
jgi:hypothetical protein